MLDKSISIEFILDSIPGFVSWIDDDLTYLGVNKELLDFFQLKKEDFVGKKLGTVSATHNEFLIEKTGDFFLSDQDVVQYEISFHRDQQIFWNLITMKKFNHGKNALLISIDITQFKEAQNKLKEEQANAIHSGRLVELGEMVGTIAHEINNPMGVITMNNSMIERLVTKDPIPVDKLLEICRINNNAVTKMDKIIKSVKNLVRDGSSDEKSWQAIDEILDDVMLFISKKCIAKGIELKINNELNDTKILCNAVQLSQVIIILLNNAIDAIEDFAEKWISVDIKHVDNQMIFSVTDSGSGIPKDIAKNIFKSFYTTKSLGKGTGIGLGLAKKIITSHQGKLQIDENSSNTKFDIYLPLS